EPDNFFSIFQTFGLFLGLAFAASAYFLYLELKRKEKEGILHPVPYSRTIGEAASPAEIAIAAVVGFFLGFKLLYLAQNFDAVKGDMVSFIFSGQGAIVGGIIGALLNGGWAWYEKNKTKLPKPKTITEKQYPHERIMDITFVAAVSSLIGAKIFAVLETPDVFLKDPIGQLFSGSGMAIYGGLIGGFIGGYWFVKNKLKIKPIHVMDAIAPALIMGYAVGRVGCQLSGDGDWGIDNPDPNPYAWLPDWLWSTTYPHNVLNDGIPIPGCEWEYCSQLATPVYPTPIYETIMALIIFGILWSLRKRITVPGVLFFIYMILNGIERFWIEKIRVNAVYKIGGMEITQAEIISVLFFVGGIIGCIILYNRAKKSPPLSTT
ncbi:MAG: diacylglyceryl transferase, partial [Flavobacteriales bacterium]|nr:diacylglyceryl transferase [Flavobacteriales bacterium]